GDAAAYTVGTDLDPLDNDTDNDGLRDGFEAGFGTDPLLVDSDGDALDDGFELALDGTPGVYGVGVDTDPRDADTDNDGLSDGFEVGFDGNAAAYTAGVDLDPLDVDSDGDGLSEGAEVGFCDHGESYDFGSGMTTCATLGYADAAGIYTVDDDLDPLAMDTDGDGTADGTELALGTDPLRFQVNITSISPTAAYRAHTTAFTLTVSGTGFSTTMGVYLYYTNGTNVCSFTWNGVGAIPGATAVTCPDVNDIAVAYSDCSVDANATPHCVIGAGTLTVRVDANTSRPQGSYSVAVATDNGASDVVLDVFNFVASPPPTVTAVNPTTAYSGNLADNVVSDRAVLLSGTNFLAVPQVEWVNVNRPTIIYQATSVELLSDTQLSAVVPSESQQMRAGNYHVRVTNPDGQVAYWLADASTRGLFEITIIPPPVIQAIDPVRLAATELDGSRTLTVTGEDFNGWSDGTGGAIGWVFSDGFVCDVTTTGTSTQLTTTLIAAPCGRALSSGNNYGIQVTNPDGQAAVYYSFSVTTSADGKLGTVTIAAEQLVTGRGQHGATEGFDDLGNGYLYVGGGLRRTAGTVTDVLTGVAGTVLGSVELAQLSYVGQLGRWQTLEQTDVDGSRADNTFVTGRTALQLVRVGRF
ncbi:MAG: hypothetical protein AAB426_12700, partial [Myxococcota bacterium]